VLWARERAPTLHSFAIFPLDSHLSPLKSWGCVNHLPPYSIFYNAPQRAHHPDPQIGGPCQDRELATDHAPRKSVQDPSQNAGQETPRPPPERDQTQPDWFCQGLEHPRQHLFGARSSRALKSTDGVRWGVGKLSRRATTLLQTSLQSEVGARSYECPKSRESNPGQFRDSSLGVMGKSAIWMWLPRSNAENTIWGKVVASPESRPWWILCVKVPVACPNTQGCSWMRTNPLVVGCGCRFKLDLLVPIHMICALRL
jgi:hypothetical protein